MADPRSMSGKKKKRKKKILARISRSNRKKMMITFVALLVLLIGLIGRLIAINVYNSDKYTKIVLAQMDYDSMDIPFKRGDITDRNGTVLATSEKVYNLILDPYVINNVVVSDDKELAECKAAVADALDVFFGIDKDTTYRILDEQAESRYVVLQKELSYDVYETYQSYLTSAEEEAEGEEDGEESADETGDETEKETAEESQTAEETKEETEAADTEEAAEEESPAESEHVVNATEAALVDMLKIPAGAIWFEEDYVRKYPYDSLAADVIGYTNSGNAGTWGLEGYYNEELNGTDGREYGYLSDSTGFERTTVPAVNGYNVVSTIDLNIQRIAEKYLLQLEQERESNNAGVIVADPNTGEILAMASTPTFNLNDPRDLSKYYSDEEIEAMSDEEVVEIYNKLWRNFCLSDTYEAGSTIKPLTISAALDEGSISLTDTYMCDGGEDLFDGTQTQRIYCHNRYGHGTVTVEEALMWSCNDALMQIGRKIGVDNMLSYHRLFGFGSQTGIDLPGEASGAGLVFTEATMGDFELATSSFGQGFNLTMVQMVAAFSSVINGGHYYQPHVVKEITSETGEVVKSFDKVLVKNTISEETCEFIKEALYKTVNDDGINTTGTAARVEGYAIGGKTGTAEKVPRGTGKYVVSFIGFAPVDDPQVVVYVVIDELKDSQEDSGTPTKMAGDILSEVLPYLQIFPESGTQLDTSYEWTAQETAETDEYGETIASETDAASDGAEDGLEEEIYEEAEEGYLTDEEVLTEDEDTSGTSSYPEEWLEYGYTDEDGDGIPDQWGE